MLTLFFAAILGLESSISNGVSFLLSRQTEDGFWSDRQMPALTALPVWAIHGSSPTLDARSRAAVERGVAYVLSTQRADGGFYIPKPGRGGSGLGNYNTSVCLAALYDAGTTNVAALLRARDYLAASQLQGDDTLAGGFGYDRAWRRRYADLSNTSYALSAMARTAALEELRPGGRRTDLDWKKAVQFVDGLLEREGDARGGAAYNETTAQAGVRTNTTGRVHLRAYGSMTYAAVLSLCSARLTRGDARVREALSYMARHWTLDENPGMGRQGLYYFYDIMARALAAAEVETVGGHIWKEELAKKLISLQRADGSWMNENNRFWEGDKILATSFALLALELCR